MAYENNHYVPRFIVNRFGERINIFDLKEGILERKKPDKIFCSTKLYEESLEKLFNQNAESRVANILFNKIINAEGTVTLTRRELMLLKRFFSLEMLRTPVAVNYINHQRSVFHKLGKHYYLDRMFKIHPVEEELSDEEYLKQTLLSILESDDEYKWADKENATFVAQKWTRVFNSCYFSIWDSKKCGEDFVISDIGMVCEHDPSRFYGDYGQELIKTGYYLSLLKKTKSAEEKANILKLILNEDNVGANFYFTPLTPSRTLVLVDPFYRLFDEAEDRMLGMSKPDIWPSGFQNKGIVKKNRSRYVDLEKAMRGEKDPNDEYIYDIVDLEKEDVIYFNVLNMDRIDSLLGFGESSRVLRSLGTYLCLGKPRKDYRKLSDLLSENGYAVPRNDFCRKEAYYFENLPNLDRAKANEYMNETIAFMQRMGEKHA